MNRRNQICHNLNYHTLIELLSSLLQIPAMTTHMPLSHAPLPIGELARAMA